MNQRIDLHMKIFVKSTFRRLFFILSAMSASLLSAAEIHVVPSSREIPPFHGKFNASDWKNALKLTSFSTMGTKEKFPLPTEIYMIQNGRTLFCAMVAGQEDVAGLIRKQAADSVRHPWALNGFEIFFGDQKNYTQLAFDYMGRLYSNMERPAYSRISHRRTGYVIRFAIDLGNLPFLPESDRMFRCNIYRKSQKGTAALFANATDSFLNMQFNGYFCLGSPGDVLSSETDKFRKLAEDLEKAGNISPEDAGEIRAETVRCGERAERSISDPEKFLSGLKEFQTIRKRIRQAQLKKFTQKYGAQTQELMNTNYHRGIPDVWRPAKILGKDYYYACLVLHVKAMEDAGLMKLPLFQDAIFRFWGERAGKELMPGGRYYGTLRKYRNPFMIGAPFGQLTVPVNHHAITSLFDPEYVSKFRELYGERFIAAYMDEAYFCGSGVFRMFLDKFGIPHPRTREEAFAAFKKLHDLSGDKPIPDVPTRNAWSTSNLTKHWVGNGAATVINHLVLSLGDIQSGNENGECCGNNPSKIAAARGAARQFGKPWRNYQIFYGWCHLFKDGKRCEGGLQCATDSTLGNLDRVSKALTPSCRWRSGHGMNGLYCGLSLERQKAVYLYPFLSGAGIWLSEGEANETVALYDLDTIDKVDPMIVNLRDQKRHVSPMVKLHAHFYDNIVKKRDRGVTVTPVALVWDRAHGYLPLYFGSLVWDFFTPSDMEKCMWAVDKHLFRPLPHNNYYGTCPYGDIFDYITNDAAQEVLDSYKVLYPVGDVTLDDAFARRIMEFVRRGGCVILNTENLKKRNPFPAEFLGVKLTGRTGRSPATFSRLSNTVIPEDRPYEYTVLEPDGAEVLAVTTDPAQAPAVTRHSYGRGGVVVTTPANLKPAGGMETMLNLFDEIMKAVRNKVIDIQVKTPMQYMISRNKTSWIIYLQNNFGIPPGTGLFKEPPRCDRGKTASAEILIPESAGHVSRVIDWWSGREIPFEAIQVDGKRCCRLKTVLPGGECQALEFVLK